MTDHEFLPEPSELGEELLQALEFLKNQDQEYINFNGESIETQYQQLYRENFTNDWRFSLEPNWIFPLGGEEDQSSGSTRDFTKKEGYAAIGGHVSVSDGRYEEYSFNLTIIAKELNERPGDESRSDAMGPCCWPMEEGAGRTRVARRYHFDIDVGETQDESKPISHLQIGGKFDEEKIPHYSPHYCLSPLDKPRIPHPPMDPILILHMLITQYGRLEELKQSGWERIVRDMEECLWIPYHTEIGTNYINGRVSSPFANYIEN